MNLKNDKFLPYLLLLLIVNVIVKPVWIFGIDATVQNQIGNHAYGIYYSTLNFVLIGNILLDFGLNNAWAAHQQFSKIEYAQIIKTKIAFSLLYIVFITIIALLVGVPSVALCIPLVILQIGNSFLMLYRFILQGLGKNIFNILASVLDRILAALFIITILVAPQLLQLSALTYSWVQCLAVLVSIAVILIFLRKDLVAKQNTVAPSILGLIKKALPFAIILFLTTLLFRADVFFIKNLHPNTYIEVANYAYGFRILDALNNFGFLAGSYLFLFFVKNITDKKTITHTSKIVTAVFLLGVGLALAILWFAGNAISNLLYHHTAITTQNIMLYCTLAFAGCILYQVYGTLLMAAQYYKILIVLLICSLAIMALLHIIYTPMHGAIAAAIITAITQLILGLGCVVACKIKKLM